MLGSALSIPNTRARGSKTGDPTGTSATPPGGLAPGVDCGRDRTTFYPTFCSISVNKRVPIRPPFAICSDPRRPGEGGSRNGLGLSYSTFKDLGPGAAPRDGLLFLL